MEEASQLEEPQDLVGWLGSLPGGVRVFCRERVFIAMGAGGMERGASASAALAALARNRWEVWQTCRRLGFPLPQADRPPWYVRLRRPIAKLAMVFLGAALVMMPVSYGLSTAIERAAENALEGWSGPALARRGEEAILRLAEREPDPQKAAALLSALREIGSRYRPFVEAVLGDADDTPR